jgi:Tfp pilus assembly protein PilV
MRGPLRSERGVLLLEATLALLIFGGGLLLLARAALAAAQVDAGLRRSAMVRAALAAKLESLRLQPFDALADGTDRVQPIPGLTIERRWLCRRPWPGFAVLEVTAFQVGGARPPQAAWTACRR